MCKQSDRAPSGTSFPRRSAGRRGADPWMSPHSRIVPFSGDHHEKSARDEWMDGHDTDTRQSTTVHDSSMEVSGSGSRRDRPTASIARPTTDRSAIDRLASTARPPRSIATTDRPRPRRVEWTTDGLDRGRAVRDGRTDGRTERTERTERTDRPNERTDRTLSRARSFARVFDRGAREREREI